MFEDEFPFPVWWDMSVSWRVPLLLPQCASLKDASVSFLKGQHNFQGTSPYPPLQKGKLCSNIPGYVSSKKGKSSFLSFT